MPYRGSLRQCATLAYDRLKNAGHPECSILRNKTGKYYVLLLPADYDRYHDKVAAGELKLVLCATLGELTSLVKHPQASLFDDVPETDNGDQ